MRSVLPSSIYKISNPPGVPLIESSSRRWNVRKTDSSFRSGTTTQSVQGVVMQMSIGDAT